MRLVALASLVLGAVSYARPAVAREGPSVDDEADEETDAIQEEALGPRSNLRTRAEEVSFDAKQRTLELVGNVRVDAPPFHLRSQRIKLARTKYGIEIEGKGSLAFCPCLGTPLKVDFERAIVAPPGDLLLEKPTLRFYDVPILPLPWFWLRSDEKLGLLPPDIAYRAQDGLFLGGGVHLPWRWGQGRHAIDLRSGAYLASREQAGRIIDGFVVDARLRTPSSTTKVRLDRLPGAPAPPLPFASTSSSEPGGISDEGLVVDARGATSKEELGVAWDADVIRGRRGVAATTDLDAAARPWDRATIEGALRAGPLTVATAVRTVTRRGGGLGVIEAGGPLATIRASGAMTGGITYDATVEGGTLRVSGTSAPLALPGEPRPPSDALTFVRAETGLRAATTAGPVEASVAGRGIADVAQNGQTSGDDRAVSARMRLALPLAKVVSDPLAPSTSPPRAASADPWVHVVEPFVEAAVLHAKADGLLGLLPGRAGSAVLGTAPLTTGGVSTALGRWGAKDALEGTVAGGVAYGSEAVRVRTLVRGRLALTTRPLGATSDVALVAGGSSPRDGDGVAMISRVRLGPSDGVRVLVNVATRDRVDPVLARAIVDAPLEPASGFLSATGTTGGAGIVIPWSKVVTTSAGADADATAGELVAARGGIELRDKCGCLTVRAMGSHRIGRTGVDVWLALDFAADR
ncbi:MAG: hypothetical protein JST00_10775 [Deltaproteobacteria bacterium]|nr:hypothetical protein [Deltaproteobacteria bacterium]